MRRVALAIFIVQLSGCVAWSTSRTDQELAKVGEKEIREGRNPRLRIGMPLQEAQSYLIENGFRVVEDGEHTGSTFSGKSNHALHYMKVIPNFTRLAVFHHQVHVLLLHDGKHLSDIKSEGIYHQG